MTRVLALLVGLIGTPAFAQGFDPAAQRLEMEQLRARTEVNAASAAAYRAQAVVAVQQLQATTKNDGGVGAAMAADAAVRADMVRDEEIRRREAEEAARDLERRVRPLRVEAPR